MKLNRTRNHPESETIVALIDVIFFLLVFFMLVGRMDATAPFEIIPPIAASGSDVPAGGTTISVGSEGFFALNGGAIDREALLGRIASTLAADPAAPLRIQAHAATELRHVLPLVAQIEALGARDLSFVVTPDPP